MDCQHPFSVDVWCGVIGDQHIGPNFFPQRLAGDIYANFLHHELPALLENVPLRKNDVSDLLPAHEAPFLSSRVTRHCLN